jgi:LysR family transcriptional regulator, nitrogen assimilation regulatory protein
LPPAAAGGRVAVPGATSDQATSPDRTKSLANNKAGAASAPAGRSAILTLRQLRYFVKIVDLGSMTRAAEHLHVAQPALGLQIRQLEQDLNTTLLQRHSRGVVPTATGQLLRERAQEILALVERTRHEIAAADSDAMETITLGLTPSLTQLLASELLVRARQEIPGLALQLVDELSFVLLDALKRRELDVALAYEVPETAGLARTPWLREELLLVTAPAGGSTPAPADLPAVTLADALQRDLALADRRDMVRRLVETVAGHAGAQARVAFELHSVQAMKILVADGVAATIMPYGTVAAELRTGALSAFRICEPRIERTLYLVTGEKRISRATEPCLLALLERMRIRLASLLGPLVRPAD